jgi:hypothetical protein
MARFRDDDDDAFDENGLLKDGRRVRVGLMMRDADALSPLQRSVARDARFGLQDVADLYAPGPRYCDAAGRERKAEAYQQMCDELVNAWRTPSAPLPSPAAGARDATPARPTYDATEGRRRKAEAYEQMVADLCDAWKGPGR